MLQPSTLLDAELVLFVDHNQAKFFKWQLRCDHGLRADDDVNFSGFNCRRDFFSFGGFDAAAPEFDSNAALVE